MTCYCLLRLRNKVSISTKDLFIGWFIKLGFGVVFLLIFSYYYGNGTVYGDAYNFMHDSRILSEYGRVDPGGYFKILLGIADEETLFSASPLAETHIWSYGENGDFMNDNRLIIRLNSLIHFISFGQIYVHVLVMAFLSYLGLLLINSAFSTFTANKRLFFFTLICFPSIAFWGSGLTKEALFLVGIGSYFYGLFNITKPQKLTSLVMLILGAGILLFNKPHVGLIILPLSFLFILGKMTHWKTWGRYLFPVLILLITGLLSYAPAQINLLNKISYKQRDLINMGKGGIFFITDSSFCAFDYSNLEHFEQTDPQKIKVLKQTAGEYKLFGKPTFHPFEISPSNTLYDVYLLQPPSTSYIPVTPINYTHSKLITTLPEVLANTTLRPFPWDPGSQLKLFSTASNILFWIFIIYTLFNRRKLTEKEKYILLYLLISALATYLIIGWTTPILGAIARYKIAAELFILIALSLLLKPLKNA